MSNFIKDCINGDTLMSDVDDYIDKWHESDSSLPLHEYLGMSNKEYLLFVEDENYLGRIIAAHKSGIDVASIIRDDIAMAARADSAKKLKMLQNWLESENLWD